MRERYTAGFEPSPDVNPEKATPSPPSCQKHYIITRTNDAFIIKWVTLLSSVRISSARDENKKKRQTNADVSLAFAIIHRALDMLLIFLTWICMGMIRI